MDDKGIGQKEFALKMDISEEPAEELIQGNILLTPEIAARLESIFGVPAEFWNKMEEIYRRKSLKLRQKLRNWKSDTIYVKFLILLRETC